MNVQGGNSLSKKAHVHRVSLMRERLPALEEVNGLNCLDPSMERSPIDHCTELNLNEACDDEDI